MCTAFASSEPRENGCTAGARSSRSPKVYTIWVPRKGAETIDCRILNRVQIHSLEWAGYLPVVTERSMSGVYTFPKKPLERSDCSFTIVAPPCVGTNQSKMSKWSAV